MSCIFEKQGLGEITLNCSILIYMSDDFVFFGMNASFTCQSIIFIWASKIETGWMSVWMLTV